jgi:hypothetical protein
MHSIDKNQCGQGRDFSRKGIVPEAMHTRKSGFDLDLKSYMRKFDVKIEK